MESIGDFTVDMVLEEVVSNPFYDAELLYFGLLRDGEKLREGILNRFKEGIPDYGSEHFNSVLDNMIKFYRFNDAALAEVYKTFLMVRKSGLRDIYSKQKIEVRRYYYNLIKELEPFVEALLIDPSIKNRKRALDNLRSNGF